MERIITYKIIEPTEENITKLELLRFNAYGLNLSAIDLSSYHSNAIRNGQFLVFAIYIDSEIAAACYVSSSYNSLFIEQLFVKGNYQETGLRLGRKLLAYINLNKRVVEEYFGCELNTSRLEYNSTKSKTLYEKLGYKETNSLLGTMKKAI